jgi:hypothetical protein
MNYKVKIHKESVAELMTANKTEIGDLMEMQSRVDFSDDTIGHIILHHHTGFVDLNNPQITWDTHNMNLNVRLLPKGTIIKLKIK